MRAGGCTVQQSLTPEATATVKQAVTLARRRGHAQVTPLHVASTMLSSPTGLLRTACLKSHSHPLQCKALELCFNVALNRLPASASPILSPHGHHMHGHHHFNPAITLSNALVAAFKRAQANQRRGGSSDTQQQQPVLTIKIELEQLIISILDDPSVSRVMREAGFSSTQVKSHVEEACTKGSTPTSPNPNPRNYTNPKLSSSPAQETKSITHLDQVKNEDVMSVLDCLSSANKRRVVIVGESLASTEGVARSVIDRIKKGEVDESISNLHFINFQIYPFRHLSREEVDQKLGEIKNIVRSYTYGGKGVVLVLEDLKWVSEFWAGYAEKGRSSYYCPIEHAIMEIRNLILGGMNGGERVWFIGVGTYQSYIKCRTGVPSLETIWGLHAINIPTGGLGLSLTFDSDSSCKMKSKESKGKIGSCWSLNLDAESQLTSSCYEKHTSMASNLPSWLHKYKEERSFEGPSHPKESCTKLDPLCCHSSKMTLNFTTISPTSSLSSFDQRYPKVNHPWVFNLETKHPWKSSGDLGLEPYASLKSSPNHSSSSSSGTKTMDKDAFPKFKELNAENLKILCNALEKKVPWQKEIIPDIASIVLQCRSGMVRRKDRSNKVRVKEDTWLFFQGGDNIGKEKIARELAGLVFGSCQDNFTLVGACSSTRSGSTDDDQPTKRARLEASQVYNERLFEALRENPHRVILMEDIEQEDYFCQMALKDAIENGTVRSKAGDEVCVGDAIIILSCESFDARSRACSPRTKKKAENEEVLKEAEGEESSCSSLDLNLSVVDEMECSFDDVELLSAVDRSLFFRLPEDS